MGDRGSPAGYWFSDLRLRCAKAVGQEPPFSYFPWIAGGWCLAGAAIAVFAPALARKIGERLVQQDSLQQEKDAGDSATSLLGLASATSRDSGSDRDSL